MKNTDSANRPITIGDYVFTQRKEYRDLVISRIISITAKNVRVVYMNYSNKPETFLTDQVVLISAADLSQCPLKKDTVDRAYNEEMQKIKKTEVKEKMKTFLSKNETK
jgi:hypothetical protein